MSYLFTLLFLFLPYISIVFSQSPTGFTPLPAFQDEPQPASPPDIDVKPSSVYCVLTFMNSRNYITNLDVLDAGAPSVQKAALSDDPEFRIDRYNCGGVRCNCWVSFYEQPDFKGKALHKRIDYDFIRDGAYGGYVALNRDLAYVDEGGQCTLRTWNTLVRSYKAVCYDFSSTRNFSDQPPRYST